MSLANLGCGERFHPDWINIDLVATHQGILAHDLGKGIPLQDGVCDMVYHSHVLEHIRRPEVPRFMQECRRVLKSGGILRVVVPDLEQICRLYLKFLEKALEGDEQSAANHEWMVTEMYDQTVREEWPSPMWIYLHKKPIINQTFLFERVGPYERQAVLEADSGVVRRIKSWVLANCDRVKNLRAWKIGRFRLSGQIHQWMYDRVSLAKLMLDNGFENPVVQSPTTSFLSNWASYNLDSWPDGRVYKPDSLFMEARKPL
jgi:predicted SAM-dependent methyltransferase